MVLACEWIAGFEAIWGDFRENAALIDTGGGMQALEKDGSLYISTWNISESTSTTLGVFGDASGLGQSTKVLKKLNSVDAASLKKKEFHADQAALDVDLEDL